jgi:hypothetical protein
VLVQAHQSPVKVLPPQVHLRGRPLYLGRDLRYLAAPRHSLGIELTQVALYQANALVVCGNPVQTCLLA